MPLIFTCKFWSKDIKSTISADKQCTDADVTGKDKSSAVAEMGDRLATIDMGQKVGRVVVGAGSPLDPHRTQCGLGRGLSLYQVAS